MWRRIAVTGLALIGGVMATGHAAARTGSSCDQTARSAQFLLDDPNTALRASVGYDDSGSPSPNDQIGFVAAGDGGGASDCGANPGERWHSLTVSLGDQPDRLREDARHPSLKDVLGPGYGPIPTFVKVTAHLGSGNDEAFGHKGHDFVFGEGGADKIDVAGGRADTVDCGPGRDTVTADSADDLTHCEKVE
jgi:hypothetical protein